MGPPKLAVSMLTVPALAHTAVPQPSLRCCICLFPVRGDNTPDILAIPTPSMFANPYPPPCCHLWDFTWALSSSVITACESCLVKTPPHLRIQPDLLPFFVTAGRRSGKEPPPRFHSPSICVRRRQHPAVHRASGQLWSCQCSAQSSAATLACLCLSFPACPTEIMQAVYFVHRAVGRRVKCRQCCLVPLKGSPKVGYFYK